MKTRQRRTNKRAQKRKDNEMKKGSGRGTTSVAAMMTRADGVKFGAPIYDSKKTKVKGYQRDKKGHFIKNK